MNVSKPIIVACKEAPERLPPVLSLIKVVANLFSDVYVVTSKISSELRFELDEMGVKVFEARPLQKDIKGENSIISKIGSWLSFKEQFWVVKSRLPKDSYVWIATADSALAIGKKLLKEGYILGLLELYDTQKIYLKLLRPYVQRAVHVVTPEICRSAIFRVWFGLSYTPTVLPNKPIGLGLDRSMSIRDAEAKKKLEMVGGRKLLLYQARMIRMETFDIAECIKENLGSGYVLGVLGEIRDKKMFQRLRDFYPELIHFDYIKPPDHLAITSHAYIGLLIYNYESLNNVFCAPNKVWEYGAVSLPMICHELPMLSMQLEYYNAGETFEAGNPESIAKAVRKIDANYSSYAQGARRLYESSDLRDIVCKVIDKF